MNPICTLGRMARILAALAAAVLTATATMAAALATPRAPATRLEQAPAAAG